MKKYDVVVAGAGLLGCFCARNLKRYDLAVAVIEKENDVACGMTKANTAVIYAGYDNKPGSLKASMCVKANAEFDNLCRELDVPFSRCGSLMLSFSEDGNRALERKLSHGIENGVDGLKILNLAQAREIEPGIGDSVKKALYAPCTGTVNPWELCIAAYENARENKVDFYFENEVISYRNNVVCTDKNLEIAASFLVDCTGINAGKITGSKYYVNLNAGDYAVLERESEGKPSHILFEQSGEKCRGITMVPTVEGTVLVGPSHRDIDEQGSVDSSKIDAILSTALKVAPKLKGTVIRTFAGVRPSIKSPDDIEIHDFMFDEKENSVSLIGIKTPGLTCAEEIGKHIASLCAKKLGKVENKDFISSRKRITRVKELSDEKRNELIKFDSNYGEIVCFCEEITKGEILDSIARGATTVEGIKHRCGAMMGNCQGGRCYQKILGILEEQNARL